MNLFQTTMTMYPQQRTWAIKHQLRIMTNNKQKSPLMVSLPYQREVVCTSALESYAGGCWTGFKWGAGQRKIPLDLYVGGWAEGWHPHHVRTQSSHNPGSGEAMAQKTAKFHTKWWSTCSTNVLYLMVAKATW